MEHRTPLGKVTIYPQHYAPELLCPIARAEARASLAVEGRDLPFQGADLWTAYEISWLDLGGKPQVRIGEFSVPCTSPNLVESKSLKLYLNSLNQEHFADGSDVATVIRKDLSAACDAAVDVVLYSLDDFAARGICSFDGHCIDAVPVAAVAGDPDADLLAVVADIGVVDEVLYSHLFKSNCPVTGQPDWASVQVAYTGRALDRSALLNYLVSFSNHQAFHEPCVERLFMDIYRRCAPERLMVLARFSRRGGLDINPMRHTPLRPVGAADAARRRLVRQ